MASNTPKPQFFNSREFLDSINGYILKDSLGNIKVIGVPAKELRSTLVGSHLLDDQDHVYYEKAFGLVLACLGDINRRLTTLEDIVAHL